MILDFYTQSVDFIKRAEGQEYRKDISTKLECVQTMRKTVTLLNNQLTNVEDLTEAECEEVCDIILMQDDEINDETSEETSEEVSMNGFPDVSNDDVAPTDEQTSQMISTAQKSVPVGTVQAGPAGINCVDPHFSLNHRFKILNVGSNQ